MDKMINISRLKEACVWLCQGEEYRVFYGDLTITISLPTFGSSFKILLSKRVDVTFVNIQFIISFYDMDYFSLIFNAKLSELLEMR